MYHFCRRHFETLDHIMVWRPTVFPIMCSPPRCRFPIRDPNLVTTEPTDDMARDGARPFAGTMVPPINLEISSSNFCGQQKWFCIVLLIWWRHSNLPIRLKKSHGTFSVTVDNVFGTEQFTRLRHQQTASPLINKWDTWIAKFMCVILRVINAFLMMFCFHTGKCQWISCRIKTRAVRSAWQRTNFESFSFAVDT